MRAILFDLDGTLLPMDQDVFVKYYFGLLAKKLAPFGYDPKEITSTVWAGTEAMVRNDGTMMNYDRFWNKFFSIMGEDKREHMYLFEEFYRKEFNGAIDSTQPTPLSKELVKAAREKADKVILATNPLFPQDGVESRLGWIGMKLEDFDLVTTYQNSTFCKPNPKYYEEIMRKADLKPEECTMFGNDVDEDYVAAAKAGIKTFIVTDCIINKHDVDISNVPHGTLQDAIYYIKAM